MVTAVVRKMNLYPKELKASPNVTEGRFEPDTSHVGPLQFHSLGWVRAPVCSHRYTSTTLLGPATCHARWNRAPSYLAPSKMAAGSTQRPLKKPS